MAPVGEGVHDADQALLQAVRVGHAIERRRVVVEHEQADARAARGPGQLLACAAYQRSLRLHQAMPSSPASACAAAGGSSRALRVELDVHRLLQPDAVAVRLAREERLDVGEVLRRERLDVAAAPRGCRRAFERDRCRPTACRCQLWVARALEASAAAPPPARTSSRMRCVRSSTRRGLQRAGGCRLKAAGASPTRRRRGRCRPPAPRAARAASGRGRACARRPRPTAPPRSAHRR